LALLEQIGVLADVPARVHTYPTDRDHARIGRLIRDAWPQRALRHSPSRVRVGRDVAGSTRTGHEGRRSTHDDAELLHAGRFGHSAPLLAVHLGAGTLAKRWPLSHWQELIGQFLEDGWRIVVVGGPEDVALSSELPLHPNLRDWSGRLVVTETAALLERADLFIGADSGPAHLAACAGVASVILFSGTNLTRQWRPWSRRSLVLRNRVPCSPCHAKTCPLAGHDCMSGLDAERVYNAARRWWARLHHRESPHNPL
jgi:heptosyltransferase-2